MENLIFLKEVKCLRILRWRDQQVSSSVSRLYVLEEELMNKLTSKVQYCCDTAVRTKYVLHVTSPVSHLTQIFHHTHVSPFPCFHTLWFSETLCVDVNILVVNYT